MPGKCSFNELWISQQNIKWLSPVATDKYKAFCKVCKSIFDVSHSGFGSITVHERGKKHKSLVNVLLNGTQRTLAFKSVTTSVTSAPSIQNSSEKSGDSSSVSCERKCPKISNVNSFVIKDEVVKAEIIWALNVVLTHSSNRSGGNASELFKIMFPDSIIADKFKMHKDKLSYVITYGLGPYFQNQLIKEINKCDFYCLSLDESLNKVSQKGQMDIIVRFWDTSKNEINTRYLTSVFLGHAKASDLLDSFTGSISGLGMSLKKIMQMETDGPNVNLKFLRDFEDHMKNFSSQQILDIGTCSLHIIHGCYKTACTKSGWGVNEFLRSIYYLFKDFPSRRADYRHFSESNTFPLKLCAVRWIENSKVIERAIKILPFLKRYVEGVRSNPPATKNFDIASKFLLDELLIAKLYFLQSVATELESFLIKFQSDKPLLPFLYMELSMLVKNIAVRCLKKEVCSVKNLRDLILIDIYDTKNQLPLKNVDIGFGARGALTEKVSESRKTDFLRDCRQFLLSVLEKMRIKSPLCKRLVKGVSCLSPDVML